jgi:hypothetical protein
LHVNVYPRFSTTKLIFFHAEEIHSVFIVNPYYLVIKEKFFFVFFCTRKVFDKMHIPFYFVLLAAIAANAKPSPVETETSASLPSESKLVYPRPGKTMEQWIAQHNYEPPKDHYGMSINTGLKEFQDQFGLSADEMNAIFKFKLGTTTITSMDLSHGVEKIPAYIGTVSRSVDLINYPEVVEMLNTAIDTGRTVLVHELISMKQAMREGTPIDFGLSTAPVDLALRTGFSNSPHMFRIESKTGIQCYSYP